MTKLAKDGKVRFHVHTQGSYHIYLEPSKSKSYDVIQKGIKPSVKAGTRLSAKNKYIIIPRGPAAKSNPVARKATVSKMPYLNF